MTNDEVLQYVIERAEQLEDPTIYYFEHIKFTGKEILEALKIIYPERFI